MASQAAMSDGPASRAAIDAPLIGAEGQGFVQTALSTADPARAIAEIQERGAMRDPRCKPLLDLLDQLGLARSESHFTVMKRARDELLSRIPTLSPEKLLRLLEATFSFIGISELRAVPIAVLDRLRPVPATFLKQLAVDREVFWELPPSVQRQTWELDRKLLQLHSVSLLSAYTYETATWMQGLNMDESLPGSLLLQKGTVMDDHGANQQSSPARHPKLPQLARRNLRNGSAALRRLTAMVGHSPLVYRGIVDLCVALYRDAEVPYIGMKEAALCALRSQLLMSLHDAGETGICSGEPCYKLAWTLDAGFKEKKFERKRLKELESICIGFDEAENTRRAGLSRPHHRPSSASGGLRNGRGGGRLKKRGRDDDAESAGVPGALSIEDPLREIGDAGMVLRDPAPFHLMLHQVMRCLERCVEKQIVPKDDPELILLTRMLTLAVSVRSMLRDQQFYFPESNPEILVTLYPMIAEMMLEAELRDTEEEVVNDPNAAASHPKELVNVMIRDEISRKAVQMYALEQLAAGDLVTGRIAIHAVVRFFFCGFLFCFVFSFIGQFGHQAFFINTLCPIVYVLIYFVYLQFPRLNVWNDSRNVQYRNLHHSVSRWLVD